MVRIHISVEGITSVSMMPDRDVRITGRVADGPTGTVDRMVDIHLAPNNLEFLLSCLVSRDPDTFLRIADAIREADANASVNVSGNVYKQMQWSRKDGQARVSHIRDAIINPRRDQ